jgi:thymidylate synthase
MYTIIADTIAPAHEAVVKLIMGTGDFLDVMTEDKEETFEYPEPVNIHIARANKPPFASPALRFGSLSLDEYKAQVLKPRKLVDRPGLPDFSYLYSNLIFDFPAGLCGSVYDSSGKTIRVDWEGGNGRGNGVNQIDYVVNKLKSSPTSRRAVVSLFHPLGHPILDEPPCLNHIQFMIRGGKLNCHALFRSNDMLSAWGGNAYALSGLQEHVADRVGVPVGWLETTSISAHIYFARDNSELQEFKKRWH